MIYDLWYMILYNIDKLNDIKLYYIDKWNWIEKWIIIYYIILYYIILYYIILYYFILYDTNILKIMFCENICSVLYCYIKFEKKFMKIWNNVIAVYSIVI